MATEDRRVVASGGSLDWVLEMVSVLIWVVITWVQTLVKIH